MELYLRRTGQRVRLLASHVQRAEGNYIIAFEKREIRFLLQSSCDGRLAGSSGACDNPDVLAEFLSRLPRRRS